MISDRDIAFSVSQKPSWDKRARMRSKMSPMFTISVESFPAVGALDSPSHGFDPPPERAEADVHRSPDQHAILACLIETI